MKKEVLFLFLLVFVLFTSACEKSERVADEKFIERCTLPKGISCLDFFVDEDDNLIKIVLKNQLGYGIEDVVVSATGCDSMRPATLDNGQEKRLGVINCQLTRDKVYNKQLTVNYTNAETKSKHKLEGSISFKTKFLSKCILPPGLVCTYMKVEPAQSILMILNTFGKTIKISDLQIGKCNSALSESILNGGRATLAITGCNNGKLGDTFEGDILLKYTEEATGISNTAKGTIATKVE